MSTHFLQGLINDQRARDACVELSRRLARLHGLGKLDDRRESKGKVEGCIIPCELAQMQGRDTHVDTGAWQEQERGEGRTNAAGREAKE